MIKWKKPKTSLKKLDASEIKDVQQCLIEVGARLSDVFGADNILWVEGSTEEVCFPLVLRASNIRPPLGTSIISVLQTGDFQGKHAKTVVGVYKKLSAGTAILPKAIGFIFDRESRSPEKIAELDTQFKGKMRFLERRMFENYLLHAEAVANVVSKFGSLASKEEIESWITANGGKRDYLRKTGIKASLENTEWLKEVDAARLLNDLFLDFAKTEYDKIIHSFQITEWLANNDPEALRDLGKFIAKSFEDQKEEEQGVVE
jgi:hypothetical protein